jgi:predicted peptidase
MRRAGLAASLLLAAACAGVGPAGPPARIETGFLDRAVTVDGQSYRYQVYVPGQWRSDRRWPVVLFLHGVGERGDDGQFQTDVGLPSAIRRFRARFPAVVVMPQCRSDAWWSQPAMQAQAMSALEDAIVEWNGDRRRVYLTGLSMGGYGTWAMAAAYPGRFAALVPVCGGISRRTVPAAAKVPFPGEGTADPFATVAQAVGKTPVWVFHGAKDNAVDPNESRRMVETIKALGGDVRYTEYPDVGHGAWVPAYADPELATWLFAQALTSAPR